MCAWPPLAASWSSVWCGRVFFASQTTLAPCKTSHRATWRCPELHARARGGHRLLSAASRSGPWLLRAHRVYIHLATSSLPCLQALPKRSTCVQCVWGARAVGAHTSLLSIHQQPTYIKRHVVFEPLEHFAAAPPLFIFLLRHGSAIILVATGLQAGAHATATRLTGTSAQTEPARTHLYNIAHVPAPWRIAGRAAWSPATTTAERTCMRTAKALRRHVQGERSPACNEVLDPLHIVTTIRNEGRRQRCAIHDSSATAMAPGVAVSGGYILQRKRAVRRAGGGGVPRASGSKGSKTRRDPVVHRAWPTARPAGLGEQL